MSTITMNNKLKLIQDFINEISQRACNETDSKEMILQELFVMDTTMSRVYNEIDDLIKQEIGNVGEILNKDEIVPHISVNDVKQDENEYKMCIGITHSPLVKSKQTGKMFSLSWQEILDMAQRAGIDK